MGILANIGGFLFLPLAGGVAFAAADSVLKTKTLGDGFLLASVCHAASGYAMYKLAQNAKGTSHDLLRGGMWGEAIAAGGLVSQSVYERMESKKLPVGVTASSLPVGSKIALTPLGQLLLAAKKKGY